MAIKQVIPKRKVEQFDAFQKLADLADAADVVIAIADADEDGKTYVRKDGAWIELPGLADGAVTNAKVAANAAIASTKLAAAADIAALTAARATPAAYSVDPADIAAVLVALGVMEADAG